MENSPHICFLSGMPQCGKTTFLLNVLAELQSKGIKPGGFVAHGLWLNGQRLGFELEDLATGERMALSERKPGTKERGGYVFDPTGLARGLAAIAPAAVTDKELVIVDEVGWLEIRGEGFAPGLTPLLQMPAKQIWVVRDFLIDEVCRKWQFAPGLVVRPHEPEALETMLQWAVAELPQTP